MMGARGRGESAWTEGFCGVGQIAKRHPQLKNLVLVDEIGITIEYPDYIVQGRFGGLHQDG